MKPLRVIGSRCIKPDRSNAIEGRQGFDEREVWTIRLDLKAEIKGKMRVRIHKWERKTRKEAHPTGVKVSMPLAAAQG